MNKKYKSIVFIDLDNTILEGPFESIVFPTIFDELSKKTGQPTDAIRKLVVNENFNRQEDSEISAEMAMDWDDIVQSVASQLDVTLPQNIVLDLVKSNLRPPYIALLDNAVEMLSSLKKDTHLVAATKGLSKYQLPIVDALDIRPFFMELLTPDTNHSLKKEIKFYGRWPEMADVKIIIGDHLMDDVVFPKRFGFLSVWKIVDSSIFSCTTSPFQRPKLFEFPPHITEKPDAIVCDLREIPDVIQSILFH